MDTLIKTGSVKNIYKKDDHLYFDFSNRYSIFDWGEMPDHIEQKGEDLTLLADIFFRKMEAKGIRHHSLGINENGKLMVTPVQVPEVTYQDGTWDYSFYMNKPHTCLIPLEAIFRFGVPAGSSLLKRVEDDKYLASLGLESKPVEGDIFDIPVIEFSTKLESTDRYITDSEAQQISGMTDAEFKDFKELVKNSALALKEIFQNIGLTLWDGKFEYAFDKDRNFMMVDSIGPDELRITKDGTSLSKENLRQYYAKGEWVKAVAKAKDLAKERKITDWKTICIEELGQEPAPFNSEFKKYASDLYRSLTNEVYSSYGEKAPFESCLTLSEVIEFFKRS